MEQYEIFLSRLELYGQEERRVRERLAQRIDQLKMTDPDTEWTGTFISWRLLVIQAREASRIIARSVQQIQDHKSERERVDDLCRACLAWRGHFLENLGLNEDKGTIDVDLGLANRAEMKLFRDLGTPGGLIEDMTTWLAGNER